MTDDDDTLRRKAIVFSLGVCDVERALIEVLAGNPR
jgi:hypothetical protein